MLKRWLSPEKQAAFEAQRHLRGAFAAPSILGPEVSLFDWNVLDAVLRSERTPDVLVVCRNALLATPRPRDRAQARHMMESGAGLVVRRAQAQLGTLRALADEFEREFSCAAHLQLFVTPGGSHGFGWHYDLDDVVILQTVGRKEYFFRSNTTGVPDEPTSKLDFERVRRETTPIGTCTLEAGDALYLPRGMWHVARAVHDALSISVGLQRQRPAG